MITQEQIDNLKAGDKLIFIRNSGVLNGREGEVFTFSNWHKTTDNWAPPNYFWQCEELHKIGHHTHNFAITDVELFDESVHKVFTHITPEKLASQEREFIRRFGGE